MSSHVDPPFGDPSSAALPAGKLPPGGTVQPRILVCDDEAAARRGIIRALRRTHYRFVECESGRQCLDLLDSLAVDLVLLDLRMPDLDGRATLERIRESPSPPPVIMITADSQLRTAIDAVRAGAADFLAKPYDIEELRWIVQRTLAGADLAKENQQLRETVQRLTGSGELLGESEAMQRLFHDLERVGPTDVGVLIRGETGTGKELVARRIHQLSAVAQGPFVALNCAAIPESLLESELFGHRKGAFTGADRDRRGRFRDAHGGTLFLDEIGDMPPSAQAKLLRVLQERRVEPLGGGQPMEVDVRVLSATHRDLEQLCQDGTFRQDLYYRLRVVELQLPPLRQRGGDILLLARALLQQTDGRSYTLSPETESALMAYAWPGNVRELKNAMERAAIFCRRQHVEVDDLPAEVRGGSRQGPMIPVTGTPPTSAVPMSPVDLGGNFQDAKSRVVETFERHFFTDLLQRHQGNVSQAAREASLHRQNMQKKLRQLQIDAQDFRQG